MAKSIYSSAMKTIFLIGWKMNSKHMNKNVHSLSFKLLTANGTF